MRKILTVLVISLVVIACKGPVKGKNGVVYKTPVQYNDYIVSRQSDLIKNILDFTEASKENIDSAGRLLERYSRGTAIAIEDIKGMPPYRGDSTLRDAAASLFVFYKKLFDTTYRQLLQTYYQDEKGGGDIVNDTDAILAEVQKEEEKLDKALHDAQREFARKNKMKLIDSEMQKKIDAQ